MTAVIIYLEDLVSDVEFVIELSVGTSGFYL